MGSRRRQGASRLAGILKRNIYVVLAVLAISGAAGFIVPFYLSYSLYGVPWRRADNSVLIVRRNGDPQVTPTWAKPSLPQARVNFWVTSTSGLPVEAIDTATATRWPTVTPQPTRTKLQPAPTDLPTRTRKPKDPTSTPRPPRPTQTQAPPRPPTDTPAAGPAPTQVAPPTEPTSGAPSYPMTPTAQQFTGSSGGASPSTVLQIQGSAAATVHTGFLADAVSSLWDLISQWWK